MKELVLLARIADQTVAFSAMTVEAVVDLTDLVPVPLAPVHIVGLAAVRSQLLTVVDCALALGNAEASQGRRAIVVLLDGHRFALLVDAVEDVVVPQRVRQDTPATLSDDWRRVSRATVELPDGFALLLDPAALVHDPGWRAAA